MKFKKLVIIFFIIITIVNISNPCSAKYVIQYTKKAVEIKINN